MTQGKKHKMPLATFKKAKAEIKEEYDEIDMLCAELNIDWSASPWDRDSIDFLKVLISCIDMNLKNIKNNMIILCGGRGKRMGKITNKIPVNKLKKLFDFSYHTKKINIIFKRSLKKK